VFLNYLNSWIAMKQQDAVMDRIYNHWILGEDAVPYTPRWCIIRDVLHWVE
jgi:hypothetical protein